MPSVLRFSEEKAMPLLEGDARVAQLDARPSTLTSPVSARSAPKSSRASLGAAGAEQPGQADDLAGVDLEVERLRRPTCGRARSA